MMGINPASGGCPVDSADRLRTEKVLVKTGKQRGSFASFGLVAASAVLVIAVLVTSVQSEPVKLTLRVCLRRFLPAGFVLALRVGARRE